jgi:4-hydroxybenzoate polyprenyltransferase
MFSHQREFLNIVRNLKTFEESPTIKLLFVSIYVSISGIFRVFISSILLNTNINLIMGLACGLIIYSVYTLDRITDERFLGSDKVIGTAVSMSAAFIGIGVFAMNGYLLLGLFPFAICYLYSKGLKISNHAFKLKGGYGIKNLVVGITWSIFIIGVTCDSIGLPLVVVFLFFCTKSFINSTINDFKDIEGDTLSRIRTLPIALGKPQTRNLLLVLLVFCNLLLYVAMVTQIISFNYTILICSFVCGIFGINTYKNTLSWFSKGIREGESLITILANVSVSILTAFNL